MIKTHELKAKKANCRKTIRIIRLFIMLVVVSINAYATSTNYSQSKLLSLKLTDQTIKEAFEQIEKQSEYIFFYYVDAIDINKKVSINVENQTVDKILNELLKTTGNSYTIKDRQIYISKSDKVTANNSSKQARRIITGLVKDINGEVLIGVTVLIKGTNVRSVTDINGKFSIVVPDIIIDPILSFSYIGYDTKEVTAQIGGNVTVTLEEKAAALEEVVIVGFGTQKKESVIGAVQSIKPTELRTSNTNLTNALGGRLAGVISVQRSGEPGADGASFWIRGASTFAASTQPLIFIDGIEVSSGDLNALPPEAIERFSILKDAAATALYGARGANGVMLVTTKSGSNMERARVNFRVTQSFVTPTRTVKIADGVDYMRMYNEAQLSRFPNTNTADLRFSEERIQATKDGLNPYIFPNVDWMDFMFKDLSLSQSANLNVTGGTQKVDYFVSATMNHDGGMLKSDPLNNFDNNIQNMRYSIQANVNFNLTSTTKIGVKLNSQILDYKGPAESTSTLYSKIFEAPGVYFPPTLPGSGEDHILFGNAQGGPISDGGTGRFYQPYAEMVKGYTNRSESTFITSFHLDQKFDFITPGLSFSGLFSYKNWTKSNQVKSFEPFYYYVSDYWLNSSGVYDYDYALLRSGETALKAKNSSTGDRLVNIQANLNYQRRFGKHDVSAMLVYLQRDYNNNNPGESDFLATLSERNQGLSGRATYGYDNRYLVEFNFGYNGSENFKEGERFGFFPSFALGYVISNENYFEPLRNIVTNLKIRGSYGEVGNSFTKPRFPYLTNVNLSGDSYRFGQNWDNHKQGAVITKYGTPTAHWEVARKLNVGIDLGIMDMFNLTFDYFHEDRRDIFLERKTIPAEMGLRDKANPMANIGRVKNQGIDMTLDFNKQVTRDLFLSAKGTLTFAQNEVIDTDEPVKDWPYQSEYNLSMNKQYGLIALGLFESEEEIANSPLQTFTPTVLPGDIKYADLNGDGKIDGQDRTYFGYPTIPELVYGLGFSAQYKRWDFSMFFQGVARTSIQMKDTHPFGAAMNTVLQYIADDYWSESNPNPAAKYPRLDLSINANNSEVSTYWNRDGSFLRLKNVELGYTYKFIRMYLSGQNLLTFSKFKYWDPELGSGRGLSYPTSTTATIGFQITL